MAKFVVNTKEEKSAIYQHSKIELSEEYKLTIDQMLTDEANGKATYVTIENIKRLFNKVNE